ncbi:hypothetical protein BGZ63DRAFT_384546 [Mariannaea sp. PMI_226]|nr:hypothetical protein BGZ63DRAFT_384546 [Mariannaea sp. PMI_226]
MYSLFFGIAPYFFGLDLGGLLLYFVSLSAGYKPIVLTSQIHTTIALREHWIPSALLLVLRYIHLSIPLPLDPCLEKWGVMFCYFSRFLNIIHPMLHLPPTTLRCQPLVQSPITPFKEEDTEDSGKIHLQTMRMTTNMHIQNAKT